MIRRPYRFVVRSYPTYYQREHGEELVETALALNGGRWRFREAAAFGQGGLAMSLRDKRRLWVVAAAWAILYGPVFVIAELSHDRDVLEHSHFLLHLTRWLKVLAVLGLLVLVKLLVARTRERPGRWKQSFCLWSTTGVISLLTLSLVRADYATHTNSASFWASYPGGPNPPPAFAAAPSLAGLLIREAIAVVVIASIAAWLSHRSKSPVVTISLAALTVLGVYVALTPWAFSIDYDIFIGDTMLGAVSGELLFFFAPLDAFGALALSICGLMMTGQVLAWGGATAHAPVNRSVKRVQASA